MSLALESKIAHLEQKFRDNTKTQFNILTTTTVRGLGQGAYSGIFVGREKELQKISNVLNSIIALGQTLGIRISGTGGVGKTHLIKYLQFVAKTKRIQQQLNLRDVKFVDCAVVDAPQTPETFWFHQIYALMWEGLGKEDFLEELACKAVQEFLGILRESPSSEVEQSLTPFIGDGWRHRDIGSKEEVKDKLSKFSGAQFNLFLDALKSAYRELERLSAQRGRPIARKVFADILLLLQTVSGDFDVSTKAQNFWKLADRSSKLPAELDQDAVNQFQRITAILNWIYGSILLIIAIDDFSNLEVPEFQDRLFTFMKTFRNATNNLCLIFSATHDEWAKFDRSIQNTDREGQLKGLFRTDDHYLDLDYLTDVEVANWLSQGIRKWWDTVNEILPPEYPWFPFSQEAIYYLINCDHHDKAPRSIGNRLIATWQKVADGVSAGHPVFLRTALDAWYLFKQGQYYKLTPYEQSLLLQFKATDQLGHVSVAIEKGIQDLFTFLRTDATNPITEVIAAPQGIRFTDTRFRSPNQLRIADVTVKFQSLKTFQQYLVEIQVKVKQDDPVTLGELDSSIDLLRAGCTRYLILLSFTGIDAAATRALDEFPGRVLLTTTSLSPEQQAYCILLGKYQDLFHVLPSGDDASFIFQKIFAQSPREFISNLLASLETQGVAPAPAPSPAPICVASPPPTPTIPAASPVIAPPPVASPAATPTTVVAPIAPPSVVFEEWVTKWRAVVYWILDKAQKRERAYRWRVTKPWLNKQPDLPKKDDIDIVWKFLIKSRYGILKNTTFAFNADGQDLLKKLQSLS